MTDFFADIGSHALLMCAAVLVVTMVTRCMRRPAFTHALWLVVLLKFLCPGFFNVPLPAWTFAGSFVGASSDASEQVDVPVPRASSNEASTDFSDYALVDWTSPAERTAGEGQAIPYRRIAFPQDFLFYSLSCVWLAGAIWVACRTAADFRRMARLTRIASAAASWQQELSDSFARQFGLRRCPRVLERAVSMSPLVWVPLFRGDPVILLPSELCRRCDRGAIETIIVHELCHLKRRDHWTRWLELVVLAVFWWHPALWWTLRELRRAADECCDAMVVQLLPSARRTYAETLLETIDFLSEIAIPTPRPAHGLGEVSFLKRRVRMIMKGTRSARTSWAQKCVVAVTGSLLLVFGWTTERTSGFADEAEVPSAPSEQQDVVAESGGPAKQASDVDVRIEVNGKTSQFSDLASARRLLSRYGSRLKMAEGFRSFKMDLSFHGHRTTYLEPYEAWVALQQLMKMLAGIEKQGLDLQDVLQLLPETIEKPAPAPEASRATRRRTGRVRSGADGVDGNSINGADGIDGSNDGKAGAAGLSGAELLKKLNGNAAPKGGAGGQPGNLGGAGGVGGGTGGGAAGASGSSPLSAINKSGTPGVPATPRTVTGGVGQAAQGISGAPGKSFQKRTASNPTGAYRFGDRVDSGNDQRVRMAAGAIARALTPGFSRVSTHLTAPDGSRGESARASSRVTDQEFGTTTLFARSVFRDYEKATFSFEHGVRDDPRQVTGNDWDLQYGNGGDYFTVAMVLDDRSRIVDLGEKDWSSIESEQLPVLTPHDRYLREKVRAVPGHLYLIHTVDRETDLYAAFRVESIRGGKCDITWQRVERPHERTGRVGSRQPAD